MSSHYRIVLLSLSFFSLSTLTHASPYPQWGSRHRQGPAVAVTNTGSNAVVPPTNDGSGGENTITTVTQGGGSNPTAVPNTGNPPTADNPSTDTGNGRRGLAYDSSSPSLDVFANSDVTWVHNWNSAPGDAPSSFTFVPTLWSDQSPHSDNWAQNAAGHQYLMSFNEPDIVGQANMEVGAAVAAFQKLMIPLRSSTVKIGAPSVSSGSGNNEAGIPMGTGWLRQFLESCNDPNTCVV